MPSDLEKFLQQAAERLAQKVNEAQGPGRKQPAPDGGQPPIARPAQSNPGRPNSGRPTPGNRPNSGSIRSAERRPMQAEIIEAEIIDAELVDPRSSRRELGPNPLSDIDTRPGLAQQISQTDERMLEHMHGVFDHEVSNLRKASAALTSSPLGETEKSIELQHRRREVNPVVNLLFQPESLRSAFIASEIFKRKF